LLGANKIPSTVPTASPMPNEISTLLFFSIINFLKCD